MVSGNKIKIGAKNGVLEVATPLGVIQGKRLNVSGFKESKEGKIITYSITFEIAKDDANLDMELSCYYDDFMKEIVIIRADGKKWKIPAGFSDSMVFKKLQIIVRCWEGASNDFRERFNKFDPSRLTLRLANKKIEIIQKDFCVTAEELKIRTNYIEYDLKIRSGCGVSHDVKEFLYLDSYYDYQEKLPILLLETRGEKYRIPFTTYFIFNVKIETKKI